ncbi:MAG: hypothetical protein O3A01_09160 [bacterium]|nr:hypothetical protein [bacterium]
MRTKAVATQTSVRSERPLPDKGARTAVTFDSHRSVIGRSDYPAAKGRSTVTADDLRTHRAGNPGKEAAKGAPEARPSAGGDLRTPRELDESKVVNLGKRKGTVHVGGGYWQMCTVSPITPEIEYEGRMSGLVTDRPHRATKAG